MKRTRTAWVTLGGLAGLSLAFMLGLAERASAQEPRNPYVFTPVNWSLVPDVANGAAEEDATDGSGVVHPARLIRAHENEKEEIVTDRPDFTEASITVPAGMIQLEMGYTLNFDDEDGVRSTSHTYPEILARIGLTETYELRIGWFYQSDCEVDRVAETRASPDGATDIYLGLGVWLSRQHGWWPEQKVNIQCTAPSGAKVFTTGVFNPGINYLYGWSINSFLSVGASTGLNSDGQEVDPATEDALPVHDSFLVFSQSATIGYGFTEKFGGYTEWFVQAPLQSSDNVPDYFFNGGLTYKFTKDSQFDIRAGVGLNKHATDFFAGLGYSVRF